MSREFAAGVPSAPRAERREPPGRRLTIPPPGQRERRSPRPDRRRRDRRTHDLGSPYGAERRCGHDDRQGDRRSHAAARKLAGVGLSRDYFAPLAQPAPPARGGDESGLVPAHLLIRFSHDG